jgi:hypothetical protein
MRCFPSNLPSNDMQISISDITKLNKFVFDKYKLSNYEFRSYEFRPGQNATTTYFIFNILMNGARTGGIWVKKRSRGR